MATASESGARGTGTPDGVPGAIQAYLGDKSKIWAKSFDYTIAFQRITC